MKMRVLLFCCFTLLFTFLSCEKENEIEFNDNIIGKWATKKGHNESWYEFYSPTSGCIIQRNWNGSTYEKGVNDTIYLVKLEFTDGLKSHTFNMYKDDGGVFRTYVEKLTYDSIVFSGSSNYTVYRIYESIEQ